MIPRRFSPVTSLWGYNCDRLLPCEEPTWVKRHPRDVHLGRFKLAARDHRSPTRSRLGLALTISSVVTRPHTEEKRGDDVYGLARSNVRGSRNRREGGNLSP